MHKSLRIVISTVVLLAVLSLTACGAKSTSDYNPPAPPTPPPPPADTGVGGAEYVANGTWTLIWSDEFNGADGSAPDSTKWTMETGAANYNGELEYYSNSLSNAHVEGGNLVITARQEAMGGRNYTSARMNTLRKFEQKYGKFEARMKLPTTQGMWPAFWMLGNDFPTVNWPTCGEIDIMELIGKEPSTIYGSIHGTGFTGGTGFGDKYTLLNNAKFSDDFHVFKVEWEPNAVKFYVDDVQYGPTWTPSNINGNPWPFQHPFFVILNLAVGGDWPGAPDATTNFPQQMLVDYVRVYQRR